ncbi:MAG: TRAP transporter small permease [Deltaproteobacteria bacterium]|nr:TRAP transporter small permease [Deltaproteobacteria bacterium]
MKKVLIKLQWAIEGITSITGVIAALCTAAAALIITEGVIVRKIFGLSAIWQIEASIFLLIFATFVGAPFVQKHEKHINVDLVLLQLSAKTRQLVIIIVSVITCILSGTLAWFAWPMWWEAVVRNDHSMSLWGPPLWIPYFFVPFGMSLLFFIYIVYIIKKITSLRKSEINEQTAEL